MTAPSKPTVAVVLVVAALALLGWGGWVWWHRHFEKVTRPVFVGPSPEARANDLLAAERLLRKMGTPVRSFRSASSLDTLPPVSATLVIPETHYPISGKDVGRLLGWVRSGGHLIVALRSLEGDPMQDSLHVFLVESESDTPARPSTVAVPESATVRVETDKSDDEPSPADPKPIQLPDRWGVRPAPDNPGPNTPAPITAKAESAVTGSMRDDTAAIVIDTAAIRRKVNEVLDVREAGMKRHLVLGQVPALRDSLWIDFNTDYGLKSYDSVGRPVTWRFSGSGGPKLGERTLGRGLVTVLSDAYWMQNDAIGDNDHAPLLYGLTHAPGHEAGPVWFVRDTEAPSVSGWMARFAWPLLLSLLALVAAGWAYSAQRFGPLQPAPARIRRRLVEHLEASGQFLWTHRQSAALLGAVRGAVHRRLDRRQPGWNRLAPDDLSVRLGQQVGLPPPAVRAALFEPAKRLTADDFTRHVRTLETIRRAL